MITNNITFNPDAVSGTIASGSIQMDEMYTGNECIIEAINPIKESDITISLYNVINEKNNYIGSFCVPKDARAMYVSDKISDYTIAKITNGANLTSDNLTVNISLRSL
jgi:hypothetical protein